MAKKKIKWRLPGLGVKVINNNIDLALKRFKRIVKDSGLLYEIQQREYYKKPSEIRHDQRNKAKLRNKYNQED